MMKTSAEWQDIHKEAFVVYDPDGWDRSNYDHDWNVRLVTEKEFLDMAGRSTCLFPKGIEGYYKQVNRVNDLERTAGSVLN